MGNLVKAQTRELAEQQPLYVFACTNPFTVERKKIQIRDRRISIRELMADLQPNPKYCSGAFVSVNGEIIKESEWNYFYPAPGSIVDIRVLPKGFIVPIIIAIASVVASVGAPAGVAALMGWTVAGMGAWAGVIGAVAGLAVSVVGYLIMNALVRPPRAAAPTYKPLSAPGAAQALDTGRDTPTNYFTGTQNSAVPYGVIPRVYGKIRMVPPLAAQGYTELTNRSTVPFQWVGDTEAAKHWRSATSGNFTLTDWLGEDQYLTMAVCWGYGPIVLRGLRIATTDLVTYQDYTWEHREGYPEDEPLKTYLYDVYEESLSVQLTGGVAQTRVTQRDCNEISIDIAFSGLFQTNSETGQKLSVNVSFTIDYRLVGTGTWVGGYVLNCTSSRTSTVRRGFRWAVDPGQYEVRITRITPDYSSQYIHADSYWVMLRSVKHTRPVNETGVALSALRIKATDQLQGTVDELNGLVSSVLLDWDRLSGRWVLRETNNPASIIRDILMGSANSRPLAESRVDLENLQDFHTWCSIKNYYCNYIVESSVSVWDVLNLVAACGRATLAVVNGKWGVVIDKEQDIPVQHFTPRNSWDFKATQAFVEEIHGFRVTWLNEDEDYTETESTIYMDGYNESNASKFEDLSLEGVTNYNQIYSLARYFLAVGEHRRETVTFTTDFEHVVCQRGDRIKYSHDVMLIGIQSGRVVDTVDNGSNYTHIVIDELVEMSSGLAYNIRCRLIDGTSLLLPIVGVDETTDTLELVTPVSIAGTFPEIGDLYTFGESNTETEDLIVKSIEPGPDLTATIECTLYASAVFTADVGPIPTYVPKITVPLTWQVPVVDTIASDGSVLIWAQGTWQSRILVSFKYPNFLPTYTGIEGWFRKTSETGEGGWTAITASLAERTISLLPVEDGATYDMKFRFVKANNLRGPWTSVYTHTVLGKTDPPADVTGLSATFFGGIVNIKWTKVADVDVQAYELRYGNVGTNWESSTVLVQALASTTALTVMLPQGTWDVLIKAIDVVGNYSDNAASVTVVVTSTYQTVYRQDNIGWPGAYLSDPDVFMVGYVKNCCTGHLNLDSYSLATGDNFEVFDHYVRDPATTNFYLSPVIDLGGEDTVRVYGSLQGFLGPGETGALVPHYMIGDNYYSGWREWSIGEVTTSSIWMMFYTIPSEGCCVITDYKVYVDKAPITETKVVNISPSGSTIMFDSVFYIKPLLQVSARAGTGGVPRIASSSQLTRTYFVGHIHTSNGTAVGGELTYTVSSKGVL